MVIDLKRCNACMACTLACKAENLTPPDIKWAKLLDRETGNCPKTRRELVPMLCMQCNEAPCVKVCPTTASIKRNDGIVWVDYDKCIGCKYCIVACPYNSRYYYEDDTPYFLLRFTPTEVFDSTVIGVQKKQLGTVQKCDFCKHRIEAGIKEGLEPGVDWEATPACVNACPARARVFGDLNAPDSEVSRLKRSGSAFQLLPELGTEPSIYYLSA
ncbi:4Fe-4S dicluster domain-containing protein [Chloroflexota bacterium]